MEQEKTSQNERSLSSISSNFVRVVAESKGLPDLPASVLALAADELTFGLKSVLWEAVKYTRHSNRTRTSCRDVQLALKLKNQQSQYGHVERDGLSVRHASNSHGLNVSWNEDKELAVSELLRKTSSKVPAAAFVKAHWLAIDGVQPAIPENPVLRTRTTDETAEPTADRAKQRSADDTTMPSTSKRGVDVDGDDGAGELVQLKQITDVGLTLEQQIYYKELTEACVKQGGVAECGNDEKRKKALDSLANDPAVNQLLPRLSTFISEGVWMNVNMPNLAILIYLMRMVKQILANPNVYLERCLHELVPAVMTCVLCRRLGTAKDNHWALRDFAAKQLAQLCKNCSTTSNGLCGRVSRLLYDALIDSTASFSVRYGALVGLAELGHETFGETALAHIRDLGDALQWASCLPSSTEEDRSATVAFQRAMEKLIAPTLKLLRKPPDNLDEYRADFGEMFANNLYATVQRLRQESNVANQTAGHLSAVGSQPVPVTIVPASPLSMAHQGTPSMAPVQPIRTALASPVIRPAARPFNAVGPAPFVYRQVVPAPPRR